jgi:uncharacterized protein (TIGR03067 family)
VALFHGGAVETKETVPANFHLRMEVKLVRGHGTVRFHTPGAGEKLEGLFLHFSEAPHCPGLLASELREVFGKAAVSTGWEGWARLGEWFCLEIITVDRRTHLRVNGVKYEPGPLPHFSPAAGVLRLWNNGFGDSEVAFRNIEIKDLKPPEETGWVQLFNGKNLTGWEQHPKPSAVWAVEDGVLVGRGDNHYLLSKRKDYQNFHLRVQAQINAQGNSGVLFRCRPAIAPDQPGYEAEILNAPTFTRTGSLFRWPSAEPILQRFEGPLRLADTWFTLEVIARGDRLTVKRNGLITADARDQQYARGQIALQSQGKNTVVRFRKIEIKEWPPTYKDDRERLQGHWVAESIDDGRQLPRELCAQFRLTFTGGKGRLTMPEAAGASSGVFHLDETATPRKIDVISEEDRKGRFGIYRFDGDRLVLCIGEDDEKDRPTEFSSRGGSRRMVVVLKRTAAPEPEWFKLFNGKDLTGWRKHPVLQGKWRVEDGVLIGERVTGYLLSERQDFRNFHLRVEAKVRGDSGVFFRAKQTSGASSGWEANMQTSNEEVGTLLSGRNRMPQVRKVHVPADTWFTMEILAEGDHITIKVDGTTTVDYRSDPAAARMGHFALQVFCRDRATVVHFRKIEIKELPD